MKEWLKCLFFYLIMTALWLLMRFLFKKTLEPLCETFLMASAWGLIGVGIYYGDRIRRRKKR